jgi:hypothetical protein
MVNVKACRWLSSSEQFHIGHHNVKGLRTSLKYNHCHFLGQYNDIFYFHVNYLILIGRENLDKI